MASSSSSSSSSTKKNTANCRSCGQRRTKTWCLNTKCSEYQGPLRMCCVHGCTFPTPHILCRTHWAKGLHCGNCAKRLSHEGYCTNCDSLVACVVDGCDGHTREMKDDQKDKSFARHTIPLCKEHWGTPLCFNCDPPVPLDHGVCPTCPDSMQCAVADCHHPTVEGRPLCVAHHKGGQHCKCGMQLVGMAEAVPYCTECDEHWKCATKGCKTYIASYKYCKKCHDERTAYLA
jgi:hypothetical protein